MNLRSQISQKVLFLLFSTSVGGSLAILCLFNLPLFYEQDRTGLINVFFITFIAFSLIIALSIKIWIVPLRYFREKNASQILLIVILCTILAGVFHFTATYYRSTPNFQSVEICYEANDPTRTLEIHSISDYRIGRIFPAEYYGHADYPISIPANACITGGLRSVQKFQGVNIELTAQGIDNSLRVEINNQVTVKSISGPDVVMGRESIAFLSSINRGSPIYPDIFASTIVSAIKWVALWLSSFFLAVLVVGVVEVIVLQKNEGVISSRSVLVIVLVYFAVFGFLMVNHGGQPDQGKHVYYSSRFSETWGIPTEDPQSPYYVTDNVYFYYWLNGAILKVSRVFMPEVEGYSLSRTEIFLLRLCSIMLSAATLFYVYRLASKVSGSQGGGILAAFFYANILMFVFISAGISFDTFVSLSSAAALFHLVCLLQQEDYTANTAWMGIWLCLGALSKNEGVLLAFILFLAWLLYSIIARNNITIRFNRTNLVLIALLAVTSGLFLEFYGRNLIQYHRPIPKCEQVKSEEACTRFAFRRELRQEVHYPELWEKRNFIVGPFEYAMNYWLFNMVNGIWGIVSHNTYVPRFTTSLHSLLIIWCIFCMARYWKKENIVTTTLLLIILGYSGYVFFLNYRSELVFNFRHFAVQGRYLFPVLGAFIALMVNYLLSINSQVVKKTILALAIILYFAGGLGTFVFRYSDIFIAWRIFF